MALNRDEKAFNGDKQVTAQLRREPQVGHTSCLANQKENWGGGKEQ